MDSQFDWDDNKAASNWVKHGIRFEEAKTVLMDDPNSIAFPDPDHSFDEARYIEIGLSNQGRLLVVVYVERDDLLRLISARKATPREVRLYDQG